MEEVLFPVLGGDEAKAAVGHDLLHGSLRHVVSLLLLEPDRPNARPVREDRKGPRRSSLGIPETPHCTKWRPGLLGVEIENGVWAGFPGGERGHPRPVPRPAPRYGLPRPIGIKRRGSLEHPLWSKAAPPSPGGAFRHLAPQCAGARTPYSLTGSSKPFNSAAPWSSNSNPLP